MRFALATFVLVFSAIGVVLWASDKVTWQGERTIYTASCQAGAWENLRCAGRMAPAERYRFRADRARGEVVYRIVGAEAPAGRFTGCQVIDRDNWSCRPQPGALPTIAHEMAKGRPAGTVPGVDLPFHSVAKWKWMAMRAGAFWLKAADAGYSSSGPRPRGPATLP